jgi:hypothetical protein
MKSNGVAHRPGQIWPARKLTPESLEEQWKEELVHHMAGLDLPALVFSESTWADLEWNARESLRLNGKRARMPEWLRRFIVPQPGIDLHLLRSLEVLVTAWQQWSHLALSKDSSRAIPAATLNGACLAVATSLDQAFVKSRSLQEKGLFPKHFSVRQYRLFQWIGSIFTDLEPVVEVAASVLERENRLTPEAGSLLEDIRWHGRQLGMRGTPRSPRPGIRKRLCVPRLEINRLAATACLYHAKLLKQINGFE